jgi:hypothetical protein
MAKRKNTTYYIYLSFFLAFVILVVHGHTILFNLNEYLFAHDATGIKNYFTTMWYVKYDGQSAFSGMNYPFGINIFFSDSQPLYAYLLHKLSLRYAGIEDFTVLFINLLMLVAIFPCIYYIYKILKYFGVGSGYASIATLLITFLSPQLAQVSSNYALSYSVVIPALWYFTLKVNEKLRYINAFWIVIILLVSSGLHADYLTLGSLFLIVLAFVNILFFKQKNRVQNSVILLSCVIVTLSIYSMILYFIGAFRGIENIHSYTHDIERILHLQWFFLPQNSLVSSVFHKFIQYQDYSEQLRSYVGMASIFVIILFSTLYNTLRKKDLDIGIGFAKYVLTALLCMIIGVLLPTSDIPKWEAWYHIPSITEIAWIFYFVFSVMAALALYRIKTYMEFRTQAVAALTLTIILMSLWAYEVNNHIYKVFSVIKKEGRIATSYIRNNHLEDILEQSARKSSDFQGILSLPFFNSGSTYWHIMRSDKSVYAGTHVAYNLAIPLLSSYLSYMPNEYAIETLNLLSGQYREDSLLKNLPNNKPFLLLVSDKSYASEEYKIIQASKYLGSYANIHLYELPMSVFSTSKFSTKKYVMQKPPIQGISSFELSEHDSISVSMQYELQKLRIPLPIITFTLEDENHLSVHKEIELATSTNVTHNAVFAVSDFYLPKGKYTLKTTSTDNSIIPSSLTVQSLIRIQP